MTRAEKLLYNEFKEIKRFIEIKNRMFNALLISDIVKDLRVNSDYVKSEWIETGLLPAVKLPRLKGGYRIALNDYLVFLENLKFRPEEEKKIFRKSVEDIIKEFHRRENGQ